MASNPFSQLTGKLDIWLALYGEPIPDVNVLPTGSWMLIGATEGDQKIKHGGKTTVFRDNDHQGPSKIIRNEEDITIKFKLVNLTLEHYLRMIADIGSLVSGTTLTAPTVSYKEMPLKRGEVVTEFAMLMRGPALSPYGLFPGQYVIPRIVQTGEPEVTFGKNQRAALDTEWMVLEDDAQSVARAMGWLTVQAG